MTFKKVSCDYTTQPSDDGLVVDTNYCSVSINVPVGLPIPSIAEAIRASRLQAFEEAAKIAERHLPAGMYPEALAGAIAAAIRQHAKGDGKS